VRPIETDDARYLSALEASLALVAPLGLTISITGGEPSKDPRLPQLLALAQAWGGPKRSVTTNGSGLLEARGDRRVIEWIVAHGIRHLNVSRAHPDHAKNAQLMQLDAGLELESLREVFTIARAAGCRPRLSCVLLEGAIDSIPGILAYLDFARGLGVDTVIFRQLMLPDRDTVRLDRIVRYTDRHRTRLGPILERIGDDPRFSFVKQIVGYYYYVEVYRSDGVDVVFEEADLSRLEREKRAHPGRIHELIFHPSGKLASTWQPWDGVLGPR
jgi:cyclic pyranopterin phosphate synthase